MHNKVFVSADHHIGHKKVIEFESEKRPFATIEEHDEFIINQHNQIVNKKDTVWFLGDVVFGADNLKKLDRMNGTKKLVMGNHDQYPISEYAKYFSQIFGSVRVRGYWLTHIPIHPEQMRCWRGNIHGHMHSGALDDPRYICVSLEQTDLKPILLDEVIHLHTLKMNRVSGL